MDVIAAEAVARAEARIMARVPAYLEHCAAELGRIDAAYALRDYATVALLAHNMRGSGGAYGFPNITEIGGALEHAADRSQADDMAQLIERLSAELGAVSRERSSS